MNRRLRGSPFCPPIEKSSVSSPLFPNLAVTDDAVRPAVAGKKAPLQALADVAKQWDEITNSLGRDPQRKAYALSIRLLRDRCIRRFLCGVIA